LVFRDFGPNSQSVLGTATAHIRMRDGSIPSTATPRALPRKPYTQKHRFDSCTVHSAGRLLLVQHFPLKETILVAFTLGHAEIFIFAVSSGEAMIVAEETRRSVRLARTNVEVRILSTATSAD
jgi:hypothetical protein